MSVRALQRLPEGTGVTIPQELLDELKLATGDGVIVTRAPDGLRIVPFTAERAAQVTAGRDLMVDFADTFRELAK